jgi:hypothetical protein
MAATECSPAAGEKRSARWRGCSSSTEVLVLGPQDPTIASLVLGPLATGARGTTGFFFFFFFLRVPPDLAPWMVATHSTTKSGLGEVVRHTLADVEER